MNIELYKLEKNLKIFLLFFIIILTTGVSTGVVLMYYTTGMTPEGTKIRYKGSETELTDSDFDIPDEYAKPVSEMLLTTHTHLISFSLIFFMVGLIFYFNTIIAGFWKFFLMILPFISIFITFSSIWIMRFINEKFVYLSTISGILEFLSFYSG